MEGFLCKCCGQKPPPCMTCGAPCLHGDADHDWHAKHKHKGEPCTKHKGEPCTKHKEHHATPLGSKPDTLLIPIFIDDDGHKPRKKHHALKKHIEKDDSDLKKEVSKKRKRAKSNELRGGVLYVGCDCEKRNGLQDDCRRTGCQGSPECLTHPPICGPSAYSSGKHLVKMADDWKARHGLY